MTFLEASGLRRSVWIGLGLFAVGGLLTTGPLFITSGAASPSMFPFQLIGLMLFLGAGCWLYLGARCPQCHLQLVRHAWNTVQHDRWLVCLNSFAECPRCGYVPNEGLQATATTGHSVKSRRRGPVAAPEPERSAGLQG